MAKQSFLQLWEKLYFILSRAHALLHSWKFCDNYKFTFQFSALQILLQFTKTACNFIFHFLFSVDAIHCSRNACKITFFPHYCFGEYHCCCERELHQSQIPSLLEQWRGLWGEARLGGEVNTASIDPLILHSKPLNEDLLIAVINQNFFLGLVLFHWLWFIFKRRLYLII